MAESTKFFRQKKGAWIYYYDPLTNRSKKLELQYLLDKINNSLLTKNKYFVLKKDLKEYKRKQKEKQKG